MKNRVNLRIMACAASAILAMGWGTIPTVAMGQSEQRAQEVRQIRVRAEGQQSHEQQEDDARQVRGHIARVQQDQQGQHQVEVRVRQIEDFEFEDLPIDRERAIELRQHVHEVQLLQDGLVGAEGQFVAANQFWIGVDCVPASPSLRVQLQLEHGLVVEAIAPDSPASRAGLQPYDVLVDYDGEPLDDVDELISVIQEKGEQSSNVKVVRQGRFDVVTVKAEPRLENFQPSSIYKIQTIVDNGDDTLPIQQTLTQWTQTGELEDAENGILRMMVVRPGIVVESEDIEIQRSVEFGDGRQLQLVGTPGNPVRMVFRERDDNAIVLEGTGDVERVPAEYRHLIVDAAKRFHWHDGPVQIGKQELSLFPRFTFAGGDEDGKEPGEFEFEVVVNNEEADPIAERPPFLVRSIEIRERMRERSRARDDAEHELTSEQRKDVEFAMIRRQRLELQRSVERLEIELEHLQQRLESLEQLERQWSDQE